MDLTAPPPIRTGSLVAVVAPASPFDREELFRGLAWLRTRYRLTFSSSLLARTGFLAGDDARRAAELASAMVHPAVEAIVCARGGYGAMRILDQLPWATFAARPKWIAGFSDVTALHLVAASHGVCSLHAMNVTGLGRTITARERHTLIHALEGRPLAAWEDLAIVHAGKRSTHPSAKGPLFGGNLTLIASMAAAGRLAVPDGAIVLLEDVTERPYRIDRMLTALRLGKHLARASAIVFGGFTDCAPGSDGITAAHVLRERTADLGIPVLAGAPFGHGAPNEPFIHGSFGTLDGTTLRF